MFGAFTTKGLLIVLGLAALASSQVQLEPFPDFPDFPPIPDIPAIQLEPFPDFPSMTDDSNSDASNSDASNSDTSDSDTPNSLMSPIGDIDVSNVVDGQVILPQAVIDQLVASAQATPVVTIPTAAPL